MKIWLTIVGLMLYSAIGLWCAGTLDETCPSRSAFLKMGAGVVFPITMTVTNPKDWCATPTPKQGGGQ